MRHYRVSRLDHVLAAIAFGWLAFLLFLFCSCAPARAADLSRGITFTDGQRLTAAQLHTLVDSATILPGFYTDKTAGTNVTAADVFLVYDPSVPGFRKVTGTQLLYGNTALITSLVEKTAVQNNDFAMIYDATGQVLSRAAISNLFNVLQQPSQTNWNTNFNFYVNDGTNTWRLTWLDIQNYLSTNWQGFFSWSGTNIAAHTNLVDADRILIWDSVGNSNKFTTLHTLKAAITNTAVVGQFRNLVITNNAVTNKINLAADEILTKSSNGACYLVKNLNVVIDGGASGTNGLDTGSRVTNTWYYVYAISDGTNSCGMVSASATAPTLPANYIYSAMVGAVLNLTNAFQTSWQFDRQVSFPSVGLISGALTASYATLSSATLQTFTNTLPPIAKTVFGTFGSPTANVAAAMAIAADVNSNAEVVVVGTALASTFQGFSFSAPFRVALNQYNVAVKSSDTTARNKVVISGYGL